MFTIPMVWNFKQVQQNKMDDTQDNVWKQPTKMFFRNYEML
jgi:hypothetical protein